MLEDNENDLKEQNDLTQEDIDYIDKEMNDAIEETIAEIDKAVEEDKELQKETEELLSTDDLKEREKIWKKYHPNEPFLK